MTKVTKGNKTPAATMASRYEWNCVHCGQPINDGTSYLWLDTRACARAEEATQAWKEEHPGPFINGGDFIFGLPDLVPWETRHHDCGEDPGLNGYLIDIAELRTDKQLHDWTLHLMQKDWLQHTDWTPLMKRKMRGR